MSATIKLEEEFQGTARFAVVRRIGAGGMGVVYHARDLERAAQGDSGDVALKTLRRLSAAAIYHLKQEFRSLADVSHPNLVRLHELISDRGRWFFTMELVRGVDFLHWVRASTTRISTGPLPDTLDEPDRDEVEVVRPCDAAREPDRDEVEVVRPCDAAREPDRDEVEVVRPCDAAREPPHTMRSDASPRARDASPALASAHASSAAPSARLDDERAGSHVRIAPSVDLSRLRDALLQLTRGVDALHRAGKLHRDIKPSNVMVTADGRVVLLDFGLAADLAWTEGAAGQTPAGVAPPSAAREDSVPSLEQHMLGTPEYMPPEQGSSHALSPASDWYSVGVVLFEALTGTLPFVGGPLEILLEKQQRDAPLASSHDPEIPADLDRLCADLLERRPSSRPSGEEILRRLEMSATPPSAPASVRHPSPPPSSTTARSRERGPLVGRERELEELRACFSLCRQGRAVAVHLRGGAGMGKSSLLRHFAEEASERHRAIALVGRCYERESVPYKAFDSVIDALSRHLRRLTRLQAEALLPRDVRALGRLFPVLMRVEAIAASPRLSLEAPDPKELRKRAFAALRELLARMADRKPLVIAIDDLQWGDVDSVTLLSEVLRPPHPPPLLFIAAFRSEDEATSATLRALMEQHLAGARASSSPPKSATRMPAAERAASPSGVSVIPGVPASTDLRSSSLLDLRRSSSSLRRIRAETGCEVRTLTLEALPDRDSRALIAAILPSDAPASVAERIVADASGNPFLVLELARFSRTHGVAPQSVGSVLSARVSLLPDEPRRLLEVVALAGCPIAESIALTAAGVRDRAPIELLRAQQLARTSGGGDRGNEGDPRSDRTLETYHDRIREAVVARMGAAQLVAHHRAIAEALEASGVDDPEALSAHYRAAGDRRKAGFFAAKGAEKASAALAFDRAVALYRAAIELADAGSADTRVHRVRLGEALVNRGRSAEAALEFLAAAAGAEPQELLELHRRAAEQLLMCGHIDEGLSVIDVVLQSLGTKLAKTPRRALGSLFFRRAQLSMRGLGFTERDAKSISKEELMRIDTYWSIGAGLALVDTIRGADFHSKQLVFALRAGEPYRLSRAFACESVFLASQGRSSEARAAKLAEMARTIADRLGDPHAQGLATVATASLGFHVGRWAAARASLEEAERTFRTRCIVIGWELATVQTHWLTSLAYLGELRAMALALPAMLEDAEARGDRFGEANMRLGHASMVWLADDDPDGGHRDVADAAARWSQRSFHLQHYYALFSRAQIDLYRGDGRAAYERVEERWAALESSLLLRLRRLRIEATHLRGRCALAHATTQGSDRQGLLRQATRQASRLDREASPWGDALALSLRAGVAEASGHRDTASALHARAIERFAALDMRLHHAASLRRRASIVGGDEGAALLERSDAFMQQQEVVDPARMTATLAPS